MAPCAGTCGCGGVSRTHIGFCGSEATQAAEPVTSDYTYHPRAQEAVEGRGGRGAGVREEGVERQRGENERAECVEGREKDEGVRVCVR